MTESEVNLQIKKSTEKLQAKIKELSAKIVDLEKENKDLQDVKKILDKSYNDNSMASNKNL